KHYNPETSMKHYRRLSSISKMYLNSLINEETRSFFCNEIIYMYFLKYIITFGNYLYCYFDFRPNYYFDIREFCRHYLGEDFNANQMCIDCIQALNNYAQRHPAGFYQFVVELYRNENTTLLIDLE
ncbi:hypothetical protein HZS_4252, partial [Henneguya salminicola]